ncbi:hypothetical protein LCL95_13160 [Bacillus timonensis]|nr:hypothetical protein [Bacillus timonensis]
MKKRTALTLFASVLLAGGVLTGCNSEKQEVKEEKPAEEKVEKDQEETGSEVIAIEDTATAKQVSAYKQMMDEAGKAKEGQEVDWELVSNLYKENLQAAVNEVDGELDSAIQAAIGGAQAGELHPIIAKQLVDKTTQSYLYKKQKNLHKDVIAALEANDKNAATTAFEELKHLAAEVLIPTAVKRDGHYGLTGDSSLEQSINAGLAAQENALTEGNLDDFKVYVQLTDKSIYRSYYLAAKSYAEKIEAAVKEGTTDEVTLQNMQAEAWGFFQAIKGSLSGGDEAAANRLNEIFSLTSTEAKTINSEEVNQLFVKAFAGKITGYHVEAAENAEAGNVNDSKIEALEGNMFLKAIELEFVKNLGEETSKELFTNAEKWFNAIADGNLDEAATLSEGILANLAQITK